MNGSVAHPAAPDHPVPNPWVGDEFLTLGTAMTGIWAGLMFKEFRAYLCSKGALAAMAVTFGVVVALWIAGRIRGPLWRRVILFPLLIPVGPAFAFLLFVCHVWPFYLLAVYVQVFLKGRSLSNAYGCIPWTYAIAAVVLEVYFGWSMLAGPGLPLSRGVAAAAFLAVSAPAIHALVRFFQRMPGDQSVLVVRETRGILRTLVGLLMITVPWAALRLAYGGVCSLATGMGIACIACAGLEAATRRRIAESTRERYATPADGDGEKESMPWASIWPLLLALLLTAVLLYAAATR